MLSFNVNLKIKWVILSFLIRSRREEIIKEVFMDELDCERWLKFMLVGRREWNPGPRGIGKGQ